MRFNMDTNQYASVFTVDLIVPNENGMQRYRACAQSKKAAEAAAAVHALCDFMS